MGRLQLKDIKIKLGEKQVLNGVTIDLWDGHIHAIVGPNGAGKSTLASIIMGREGYRHFEGDIIFDGVSIRDVPIDERARLGITMAWQEPARYEGLSVKAFIMAAAKKKTNEVVDSALETVGLDPEKYRNRSVDKTLSGGERKKIELASILVMEPAIVMLDEPDSGIDVASLIKIFDVMRILKDKGSTIVLITHSETVLKEAEHAFLLCNGKLLKKGVTDSIHSYFVDVCDSCDHQNEPRIEELTGESENNGSN
ncbi:MAG: ATP-binding cassette domain-containing protein [Candidatus Kapaibacterium sp.]